MEENLKNNMYDSHDEHDEKNDFSASIYQSFPGQDRFGFPEYLARVTSGYGGETFLIFGSEKTALYDCGMAYSANSTIDNIYRELKSHGRKQLDIILLSHTHYDHIGALPYILKEWPAATVYAAEKAKSVFESEGARKTMERLGESAYHEFKAAYGNEFEKYEVPEIITDGLRVDIVCKDDDFIDLGDIKIRVLECKGHTDCSLAFALEPMQLLLTCESTGVLRNQDTLHTAFVKNYWESIDSAKKCKAYGASQLMIPHFGMTPMGYTEEFFDWYMRLAEKEKNLILSNYQKGLSMEDIYQEYKAAYWSTERGNAQPYAAFKENGKHIINNIIKLYKEYE